MHRAVRDAVKVMERVGASILDSEYPAVEEDARAAGTILLPEAATIHYRDLIERREEIGSDVVQRLEKGLRISVMEYAEAKRTQAAKYRLRERFFEKFDLLLTPTLPIEPPLILGADSVEAARQLTRFTCPFNLAGLPAISIPCGFSRNGLPVGLQLVAAHWKESTLLRVAHVYEKATRWKDARPKMD